MARRSVDFRLDQIRIVCYGIMLYVLCHYSDYIYKFGSLNFFSDTRQYAADLFRKPAALLVYAGRFLTSLCHHPVMASVLVVLLLSALTACVGCRLIAARRLRFLAIIPSLGIFYFISGLGYKLVVGSYDAVLFTQVLGFMASVLVYEACRRCLCGVKAFAVPALVALVAYPLTGYFALLAMLMLAVNAAGRSKGILRLVLPVFYIGIAAAVPVLEYALLYNTVDIHYVWSQGSYLSEWGLVAASAGMVLCCVAGLFKDGTRSIAYTVTALCLYAAAIAGIYTLPCRDALFHSQMACERAMDSDDWDAVLKNSTKYNVTNDVLVAYRNAALYELGRLSKDCLKYSFDTVPVKVGDQVYNSSRVAGPAIFFHSGLWNFAARWALELDLYAGYPTLERMKFLAKVALFKGDEAEARKYLEAISHAYGGRTWARRYLAMLEDPALLAADPEYAALAPLQEYEESSWTPSDKAAYDVMYFYAYAPENNPQLLEWKSAVAAMTLSGLNRLPD